MVSPFRAWDGDPYCPQCASFAPCCCPSPIDLDWDEGMRDVVWVRVVFKPVLDVEPLGDLL